MARGVVNSLRYRLQTSDEYYYPAKPVNIRLVCCRLSDPCNYYYMITDRVYVSMLGSERHSIYATRREILYYFTGKIVCALDTDSYQIVTDSESLTISWFNMCHEYLYRRDHLEIDARMYASPSVEVRYYNTLMRTYYLKKLKSVGWFINWCRDLKK